LIDSNAYKVAFRYSLSAASASTFKIDKQLLVLFEYLIVSLDKINNKKNYFENDESFLVLHSKY